MIYFFMLLVWFLFQFVVGSISSASADLPEVIDFCCTPCTSIHRLGIFWADGLNNNICRSGLPAFWHVYIDFLILSLCNFYCFCFCFSKSFVSLGLMIIMD